MVASIKAIEYDPNRSPRIALLSYEDGEKRYIIAPDGIKVGNKIISSRENSVPFKVGNSMPLFKIPDGIKWSLKVVSPTEEDKQETVLHINDIYEKASKNPLFLENYIESSYPFSVESLSGNYNDLPLSRLPDQIYDLVKNSEGHKLYEPIILQQNQSILLLYVYDVFPERVANLENSYDFIKSAALNKKIVDFLNEWLFLAKQDVYINFLEK